MEGLQDLVIESSSVSEVSWNHEVMQITLSKIHPNFKRDYSTIAKYIQEKKIGNSAKISFIEATPPPIAIGAKK